MKKVEEIVEGFLAYLASKRQLDLLPQILRQLTQKVEEEEKTAYITSGFPLTESQENKIRELLKQRFTRDFKIEVKVEPEIIGGLIIKVGDQIIDLSFGGRLKILREKLEGYYGR